MDFCNLLVLFIIIFYLIILSTPYVLSERQDEICGHYAVITKIDEFLITQKIKKTLDIDLTPVMDEMGSAELSSFKFRSIAEQYNTEEKLRLQEPDQLIPFTSDFNLIKVSGTNPTFANICKTKGARMVEFEPEKKDILVGIMTSLGVESTPVRAYVDKTYLVTSKGSVLDAPVAPETKLLHLKSAYAQFTNEGQFEYPRENTLPTIATTIITGLCMKPNNYWDLQTTSHQKWLNVIKTILKTIQSFSSWKDAATKMISRIPIGTNNQARTSNTQRIAMRLPDQFRKIMSFFNKYQARESWENSNPRDSHDFFSYLDNFKAVAKYFGKILHLHPTKKTLTLPVEEMSQLKEHMAVRGLSAQSSNSMIVRPIQVAQTENQQDGTSTSIMTAEVSADGADEDDLVTIYLVKPFIRTEDQIIILPNISHIIQKKDQFRATQQQPIPFGCNHNQDETKTCQGFHMPKVTSIQMQDALKCGKALMSTTNTTEITKCPMQPPVFKPLVYQVQCLEMTAAISSIQPMQVRVYCDGVLKLNKRYTTFPIYFNTYCEIREFINAEEKVILPQRYDEILQTPASMDDILKIVPIQLNSTSEITLLEQITSYMQTPKGIFIIVISLVSVCFLFCLYCCMARFFPKFTKKCFKVICCNYYIFKKIASMFKCIFTCNGKCCGKDKNKKVKSKNKSDLPGSDFSNSPDSSSSSEESSDDEANVKLEMKQLKRLYKNERRFNGYPGQLQSRPVSATSIPFGEQMRLNRTSSIVSSTSSMFPPPHLSLSSLNNINNPPYDFPSKIETYQKRKAHTFRMPDENKKKNKNKN